MGHGFTWRLLDREGSGLAITSRSEKDPHPQPSPIGWAREGGARRSAKYAGGISDLRFDIPKTLTPALSHRMGEGERRAEEREIRGRDFRFQI